MILEQWDLLVGIEAMKRLGSEGADIAATMLELRDAKVIRLSWELWRSFTEATGEDCDALLSTWLPRQVIEHAQSALFDDSGI